MKIQTNLRAGAGGTSAAANQLLQKVKQSSKSMYMFVTYVPPASRCIGV